MRVGRRRWTPSLRQGKAGRWTDRQAAILMGVVMVLVVAVPIAIVRYARSTERTAWPITVPWDPSWPPLPAVSTVGALSVESAQTVYALVTTNEDTLQSDALKGMHVTKTLGEAR